MAVPLGNRHEYDASVDILGTSADNNKLSRIQVLLDGDTCRESSYNGHLA